MSGKGSLTPVIGAICNPADTGPVAVVTNALFPSRSSGFPILKRWEIVSRELRLCHSRVSRCTPLW